MDYATYKKISDALFAIANANVMPGHPEYLNKARMAEIAREAMEVLETLNPELEGTNR